MNEKMHHVADDLIVIGITIKTRGNISNLVRQNGSASTQLVIALMRDAPCEGVQVVFMKTRQIKSSS